MESATYCSLVFDSVNDTYVTMKDNVIICTNCNTVWITYGTPQEGCIVCPECGQEINTNHT